MATFPPGGINDVPDGDRKRLMQRADSFAIGKGARSKKSLDEIDEFDDALSSVVKKAGSTEETENEHHSTELEKHREDHAQMEAERRGSSSPGHQPFLGLSVLPGIAGQNLAVGQSPESHSKKRSSGVVGKDEQHVESVSQEILQGLRQAGLSQPIVTLDDPRVAGNSEELAKSFVLSLRSNERVYVWSQNHCHQVLTVGLHDLKLESAVGTTVETLSRRGKVDEKTVRKRPAPESFNIDNNG